MKRRNFLSHSGKLLAGFTLVTANSNQAFAIMNGGVPPSDQLNIGAIGIKGMGWSNVKAALKVAGVNLVAVCDIDDNVIADRLKELADLKLDASKVKVYHDYRELLENKDIDAVIIGTPDHWHCLMMVDAVQAGKDVYVEKPVGNSIVESNLMVQAQHQTGRIVQAGQWQRSQQHFRDAVDFVHSGQLGKIRTVKVWCYLDWKQPLDVQPDSPVPAGVDYKRWLGPAPERPFNINRFHFTFRWFWDYAGGLMTDWGVHLLDYALLGMQVSDPKTISAAGGKFAKPNSADETPDTLMTIYEFDQFNVIWDHALGIGNGSYGRDHGIAFIGNSGTLVLNRAGWEVLEEKKNEPKVSKAFVKQSDNGLEKHWQNFVACVKSRNTADLHCNIQSAAHIANLAQMGNIAYRSNQKLYWDMPNHRFTDEAINKKYLAKEYHNGYHLPKL